MSDSALDRPRHGDWFLSCRGRQLWPCDIRPQDIDLEEIAHGLSMICRFGGQCNEFYSVAQHSVLVAVHLPPNLQLAGLLHDATEAYLGDVIRPLKRHPSMAGYVEAECRAWEAIAVRFGLPAALSPEVKTADNRMLITERRDLLPDHPWLWKEDEAAVQPYPETIRPLSWRMARLQFLEMAEALMSSSLWSAWSATCAASVRSWPTNWTEVPR